MSGCVPSSAQMGSPRAPSPYPSHPGYGACARNECCAKVRYVDGMWATRGAAEGQAHSWGGSTAPISWKEAVSTHAASSVGGRRGTAAAVQPSPWLAHEKK